MSRGGRKGVSCRESGDSIGELSFPGAVGRGCIHRCRILGPQENLKILLKKTELFHIGYFLLVLISHSLQTSFLGFLRHKRTC